MSIDARGSRPAPSVALRTCANVGRLAVRAARRTARQHRGHSQWWAMPLRSRSADVTLVPVTVAAAGAWEQLVTEAGTTPPAAGLAASPLGGRNTRRSEWVQACLQLRAQARQGAMFAYLIEAGGELSGEALAFIDGGTSAAELVVWLAPTAATPCRYTDTVELLTTHIFAGPDAPERALVSIVDGDWSAANGLTSVGFVQEGVLRDPPRGDRAVFVAHRQGWGSAVPQEPADSDRVERTGPASA